MKAQLINMNYMLTSILKFAKPTERSIDIEEISNCVGFNPPRKGKKIDSSLLRRANQHIIF